VVAGSRAASSLPAAGALVLGMPVLLLALDGAVGGVPAAVVHGLFLAVVALQGEERKTRQGNRLRRPRLTPALLEHSSWAVRCFMHWVAGGKHGEAWGCMCHVPANSSLPTPCLLPLALQGLSHQHTDMDCFHFLQKLLPSCP
jgi:hypothetical protein